MWTKQKRYSWLLVTHKVISVAHILIKATFTSDLGIVYVFLHTVTRIIRVIAQPRGNMLLIGIGGSGRQSLSRLSAYIIGFKVFQIEVTKHYRKNEFREGMSERILYAAIRSSRFEVLVTATSVIVCSHKFNERRVFFFLANLKHSTKSNFLFYPSLPQRALCASMAPWPSLSCHHWHIFVLTSDRFIYLFPACYNFMFVFFSFLYASQENVYSDHRFNCN